ncbi:MAG: hypothetical protein IPK82_42560 [Polyangiaceae bacterium]|nr:hypothetical protein [Polyangiaceae bacterium]
MIDPDEPIADDVTDMLAAALKTESDNIQPVDIGYEYSWVQRHRVVVAYNEANEMAAVAVPEAGEPVLLTGNLPGLSAFLVA